VAAVATGPLAWRWQLEQEQLKGTLLLHTLFGSASAGAPAPKHLDSAGGNRVMFMHDHPLAAHLA
jgi:hypothetical protein